MLERNSLYGDVVILVDHLVLAGIDGVEDDLVLPVVGMVLQQRRQQFLQILIRVDMHRLRTFEHTERGQ